MYRGSIRYGLKSLGERLIKFDNVEKRYGSGIKALDQINLEIQRGEFVFLVGPSGAGKSTLLKLISREEKPSKGDVIFESTYVNKLHNREIPFLRRQIGVIFQDFKLLENKTVYENVAYALEIVGASRKKIKTDVPKVLDLVGLDHRTKSYPRQLSGGEAQRVTIARSVIKKPKVLLADEPTGNLDVDTSLEIMNLLLEINQMGTTVIMATHAKYIVDRFQRRVISLDNGQIISDEKGGYDG